MGGSAVRLPQRSLRSEEKRLANLLKIICNNRHCRFAFIFLANIEKHIAENVFAC